MGIDSTLRGVFFISLPTSSFEEEILSLEFDPHSYMEQFPLVPCLSPSSIGLDLDWFVTCSLFKDM
jgi:hypothetical protein